MDTLKGTTCEKQPSESWKCCSATVWRCWTLCSSLFSALASVSCCCRYRTWLFRSRMPLTWADGILGSEACKGLIKGSFKVWRLVVQWAVCLRGLWAFLSEEHRGYDSDSYIKMICIAPIQQRSGPLKVNKWTNWSPTVESCYTKCLVFSRRTLRLAICMTEPQNRCPSPNQSFLQYQMSSMSYWSVFWRVRTTWRCWCCCTQRHPHLPSGAASHTSLLVRKDLVLIWTGTEMMLDILFSVQIQSRSSERI